MFVELYLAGRDVPSQCATVPSLEEAINWVDAKISEYDELGERTDLIFHIDGRTAFIAFA